MVRISCILVLLSAISFQLSAVCYAQARIDLKAIKVIESSNNPLAYNSRTKCYGLYQISEICLKDFNYFHGTDYRPKSLFDPLLNKKISAWYFKRIEKMLKFYNVPVSLTAVLASYNWGIGNVLSWHKKGGEFCRLPGMTRAYIRKYKKLSGLDKNK